MTSRPLQTNQTDPRLILLSPADNCLIAAARLEGGTQVEIEGERVTLAKTIELGHKVARRELAKDDKVLRYGAVIGHVTEAVARGAHLHTHNLESDYLPTYTHDAGHEFVHH
ncbi:SAF domain protein [Paraburkholderia xenovorans LB400]|uniref:Hydrolase n=1 Tax=Paraburkholderia xenovorans (strain LB400) TaxID=266265 RepID=Q13SA5_PARXL|nr:UxaA family hydrolase [Paraburkholderia xenovorans]ABE33034.1 Putative hydrolase [Paraburkholderia xenovorans LB400]AIP36126.1 SAF domain protein [Paraburkholderia xenovorans LB400]